MSLDFSGGDNAVSPGEVSICISGDHPLVKLANSLSWATLMSLVAPDLKQTTAKGLWWMGRKIVVRVHLAAYLLQKLYDLTDRQTEYCLKDNAAFQVFAGRGVLNGWHCPDHTKIAEFRGRLSPETQRTLANIIAQAAVTLGFGDPAQTDIDSTVQEANVAYPADVNLMTKLVGLGRKVVAYVERHLSDLLPKDLTVDLKAVKAKARSYSFLAKNVTIEKRRAVFKELLTLVKKQMRPVVELCSHLSTHREKLPWNVRRAFDQVKTHAWRYLLDVAHFTRTHTIKEGKLLSFHARSVACITKGKLGKAREFGRVFQIGRIKGNFLFVGKADSVKMNDKQTFVAMLNEHAYLFGENAMKSVGADKGYWSRENRKALVTRGVVEIGLQHPHNAKDLSHLPSSDIQERLRDRRAGIEPLIGHVKHGGQLGRSRMKSDRATLAAGYASVLGFNLRQIIRKQAQCGSMAA
jgi:IS5 family transposase